MLTSSPESASMWLFSAISGSNGISNVHRPSLAALGFAGLTGDTAFGLPVDCASSARYYGHLVSIPTAGNPMHTFIWTEGTEQAANPARTTVMVQRGDLHRPGGSEAKLLLHETAVAVGNVSEQVCKIPRF